MQTIEQVKKRGQWNLIVYKTVTGRKMTSFLENPQGGGGSGPDGRNVKNILAVYKLRGVFEYNKIDKLWIIETEFDYDEDVDDFVVKKAYWYKPALKGASVMDNKKIAGELVKIAKRINTDKDINIEHQKSILELVGSIDKTIDNYFKELSKDLNTGVVDSVYEVIVKRVQVLFNMCRGTRHEKSAQYIRDVMRDISPDSLWDAIKKVKDSKENLNIVKEGIKNIKF